VFVEQGDHNMGSSAARVLKPLRHGRRPAWWAQSMEIPFVRTQPRDATGAGAGRVG
jgi:hypothetical protein